MLGLRGAGAASRAVATFLFASIQLLSNRFYRCVSFTPRRLVLLIPKAEQLHGSTDVLDVAQGFPLMLRNDAVIVGSRCSYLMLVLSSIYSVRIPSSVQGLH